MKLLVKIAAIIGAAVAAIGTTGCYIVWVDEPTMPKHMLDK